MATKWKINFGNYAKWKQHLRTVNINGENKFVLNGITARYLYIYFDFRNTRSGKEVWRFYQLN
jgi:hypothetical protein